MNPYADILKGNYKKLLNCYDLDPASGNIGLGDRLYWGWKVIDFPNDTLQGGVHALSVMLKLDLVEEKDFVLEVIDKVILAVKAHGNSKGSQEEAYPSEHSFCVTALVAFDILSAIRYLGGQISDQKRNEYLDIVRPLIQFITRNGEEHAIISNHLATGVAAICLWNKLAGDKSKRHIELLDIIYSHQSEEGWHKEYEGADPGYNTLCLYYLAAAYDAWPDEKLKESILNAGKFLQWFVHPDGTIGGLYGSRNTEVFYPAGLVAFSKLSPELAGMARQLEKGLEAERHLLPEEIDIGNYIPLLNSYAMAAVHFEASKNASAIEMPCVSEGEKNFEKAGIYIQSTAGYYAIVNYKKGGTLKVFDRKTGKIDLEDGGLLGELANGKKVSTQVFNEAITFTDGSLWTELYHLNTSSSPSPFTTLVVRAFSLTIFRSVALGNLFKKSIVNLLMTGKKSVGIEVERQFHFDADTIRVRESVRPKEKLKDIGHVGKFKSIHMASSGYFMKQATEQPAQSRIVTFE